jgi:H+-translocating NAD(P) transhydrogenase subunit beta
MNLALQGTMAPLVYMLAAVSFILSLTSVVKVRVARRGRVLAGAGLLLASLGVLLEGKVASASLPVPLVATVVVGLAIGLVVGRRTLLSVVPARLAFIPALAGAATALAAAAALLGSTNNESETAALALAVALGAASCVTGIFVAVRASNSVRATAVAGLAAVFAGWAAALVGLALENAILLVAGGVAGTAALTLARITAHAAGRTLPAVLLHQQTADADGYLNVRSCGTEEAAMVLETARKVLIVPGFGMPASQAQHAVKELVEQLEKRGGQVNYAMHPAAGCLPGHMNISLDEANVPHDKLVDLSAAQRLVPTVDAVLVVGANDTINAAAAGDVKGPLYGIEALDLTAARAVFVIKRTLRPGAGGVRNPLFEKPNTMMMFGDGKRVMQGLVAALKVGGSH